MQTQPATRDHLIEHLRAIESETERVFLDLAESLPALVREMRSSLDRSGEQVSQLDGGRSSGIAGLVQATRTVIDDGAAGLEAVVAHDAELLDHLRADIARLSEIESLIATIRRDSEDMELVSLNAMTVALKAGSAGRAFSYITEELKRLSNQTISLSEDITGRGEHLISAFTLYERSLAEARSLQEKLFADFRARAHESFGSIQAAVTSMVAGLSDLRSRSSDLQQPINGLMETIQLQDLIRQSIDHVVLALESIRAAHPAADSEVTDEEMDELAFERRIPPLASRLIDDVARQIEQSVDAFQRLTGDANQRLEQLERDRRRVADGVVSRPDGTEQTIAQLYEAASQILRSLTDDLSRDMTRKQQIIQRSGDITAQVTELESRFQRLHAFVTRFRSIDIASRIEVAKQSALRAMGMSTEEMTSLTRKIETDVTGALEATREFIRATTASLNAVEKNFEHQSKLSVTFSDAVRGRYEELTASRTAITQLCSSFSLFTDGFNRVFVQATRNDERLTELARLMRSLEVDLAAMSDHIEGRYQSELARRGLTEWSIGDDRLRSIIDRFTIFSHKQQAGDLAGFALDEGTESGEVTLF